MFNIDNKMMNNLINLNDHLSENTISNWDTQIENMYDGMKFLCLMFLIK